jgi:hypothetical protein
MAFLKLELTKLEADLENAALTAGTSLGAASARGDSLLQTTGAGFHTRVFATEKPQNVLLPLPNAKFNGEEFEISNRTNLLASVTRLAASINGTLCTSVSGQAAVPLQLLLAGEYGNDLHSGSIPVEYANWPALSSVLGVRNLRVVDEDGTAHKVVFTHDADKDERIKSAQQILINAYNSTMQIRAQIPYAKAPGLSKSHMKTPFGVDGAGYSFTAEVVNKPPSLSDAAMEAMAKAAMVVAFGNTTDSPESKENHDRFIDHTRLGMTAAVFAEDAASALSTIAAGIVPYRADGRTALLPTKLKTFPSESWSAEGTQTDSGDDCDGSAAFATAFFHRTRELFATSADAKTKFPYLYGLHRALAHHEVAIAVLGASADNADAADESHTQVAGHAMVLLIPRLHLVQALDRGARAVGVAAPEPEPEPAEAGGEEGEGGQEEDVVVPPPTVRLGVHPHFLTGSARTEAELSELRSKTLDALYPAVGGPLIDSDEARVIAGGWDSIVANASMFASLTTLAVEGTSAAFSRLHTADVSERAAAMEQAKLEQLVATRLSPSIAVVHKRLDATQSGKHAFYADFVEIILGTNSPLLNSPALQDAGTAAAHYVLATPGTGERAGMLDAGVTPTQIASNDFHALPLSTFNRAEASIMRETWAEVRANTLGRAAQPISLEAEELANLTEARAVFTALDAQLRAVAESEDAVEVSAVFTPTGLIHNAGCTKFFADLVTHAFDAPVSGSITLHEIPDLATDAAGKSVGLFATARLLVPRAAIT